MLLFKTHNRKTHNRRTLWRKTAIPCLAIALALTAIHLPGAASAQTGITFQDIAADPAAGIDYRRTRSTTYEILLAIQQEPSVPFPDIAARPPMKPRGIPGIALFDYDGDGDLDLYASNGPNTTNSLYANQLRETGELTFVDLGGPSGAGAFDQDSTGVAFGDIDNDGDHDLYVLGRGEPNRLFTNNGDGTFTDITAASGTGAGEHNPMSACLGDVNQDGLLDIFVANSYKTWEDRFGVLLVPWDENDYNQLFLNLGGNVFADVSDSSGINELDWSGVPPPGVPAPPGAQGASLACGIVDYDRDGDVDIFFGDDQGGMPGSAFGGTDRGFVHVLQNDGSGHFTDVMQQAGTQQIGGWMGFTFGDYNSDGHMDFFSTNAGAFLFTVFNSPGDKFAFNSAWFLGRADATFDTPSVGDLIATPFGWGTSTLDFDNDGDQDIIYHGSHDTGPVIEKSNPGALLENDGYADFTRNTEALANSADHRRRGVHGVAVGDLNEDGFVDMVTSSNQDFPNNTPILPFPDTFGSPFGAEAGFIPTFHPIGPGLFAFTGLPEPVDGTLSVEISSADNGNGWAEVRAVGMVGLTPGGRVNRDGIGAIVTSTPRDDDGDRPSVMVPVLGGSSLASQDSLAANFGLGSAPRTTIDIEWPGGVRNRLYDVKTGSRVVFPEIPCSFDDPDAEIKTYEACVRQALEDAVASGVDLSSGGEGRFFASAVRAFFESR